jgi:inorganic pyrophosphatase
MPLQGLAPFAAKDLVNVVVETPRGAVVKLKWEPELRAFALKRPLPLGFAYPFDWGFVPGTEAEDGDPLDALVVSDAGSPPGTVLRCRVLGALEVSQKGVGKKGRVRNDRLICVPEPDPRTAWMRSVNDLPERMRDELAHFFVSSVAFEKKELKIVGWVDSEAALELVRRTRVG